MVGWFGSAGGRDDAAVMGMVALMAMVEKGVGVVVQVLYGSCDGDVDVH